MKRRPRRRARPTAGRRALAALASPGGHLAVLVLLFAAGVAMAAFRLPKGEDVIMGVLGALLMALTGGRREPPPAAPACPYAQIGQPFRQEPS